jgi:pantoate kinase
MTGVLRAHVRAPAALSSIFSPKILDGDKPRINPDVLGACGGGFSITPGVETWVSILPEGEEIHVNLNDYYTSFPPSATAARLVMKTLNLSGEVYIRHRVYVPIATGFGTSASAALSTILAISHAAGKPVTLNLAIRLAHYVELECRTGLNSEIGFGHAGLVLVRREGTPPHSIVDEIPLPHDCRLVSVVAGPIETSKALTETEKIRHLEKIGDAYLEKIFDEPTPENFLSQARQFAVETGLADMAVMEIFESMKGLPIIGYAQNMLGQAVHALVYEDYVQQVLDALRRRFPTYNVFVSNPSASVSLKTF